MDTLRMIASQPVSYMKEISGSTGITELLADGYIEEVPDERMCNGWRAFKATAQGVGHLKTLGVTVCYLNGVVHGVQVHNSSEEDH